MEIFKKAESLPGDWDQACGTNYALKKDFLSFMEEANPCSQQYYVFRDINLKIDSIFMTFKKKRHNIAMFSPISCYMDITFIYVPLSVANSGMVLGKETKLEVEKVIKSIKGCKLILNLKEDVGFRDFAVGLTCSNILLDIKWNSFSQYLEALRSNYRHRYKKAIKKAAVLTFYMLEDNSLFNDELYNFYEQVFHKSKLQVEKLSKAFFQGSISKIIVAKQGEKPIAFIQLIENEKELVFGFIGMDYNYNNKYDLYINMLLNMVEYAIVHRFEKLDLGQTADEVKLKLGGRYEELYALVHHSNFIINFFIQASTKFIEYKPIKEKFNVFKYFEIVTI